MIYVQTYILLSMLLLLLLLHVGAIVQIGFAQRPDALDPSYRPFMERMVKVCARFTFTSLAIPLLLTILLWLWS